MQPLYKNDYNKLTDLELVDLIIHKPHCEEAAVYLLYNRYLPLVISICKKRLGDTYYVEDVITTAYLDLKGANGDWSPLATYRGKSHFPCWMKCVIFHCALKIYRTMIEMRGDTDSIDIEDENGNPIIVLPDMGEEEYERRHRKVLLIEAIKELKNADDRFCVLKNLEGYSSKEIAEMLQQKWIREGLVKVNNKGERVVPTDAYIDVRFARAKVELKKILSSKYL